MKAKKRTSLDAVFRTAAASVSRKSDQSRRHAGASAISEGTDAGRTLAKRPGVKQHTAYLPITVHEQLRKLAFEEHRKIHTYFLEGLDRVFAERGLPTIEELKN